MVSALLIFLCGRDAEGGGGDCAFFVNKMSMISAITHVDEYEYVRVREHTTMCHIFVPLNAAFHADPSSLKGMGAP